MRKIHSNVPVLFVPEEWTVTEYGFNKGRSLPNETVFSVGNGYLGVRGYFEEGVPSGVPCEQSLLINGVYEYHPYRHIWQRPGFPGRYHSIFSQVNALALKVYADGELCTPFESAENYMRRLDLKNGVMKREYDFITSANKRLHISLQRFACQNDVHVLMHRVEISSDEKISVRIETPLCLPARADGIRKEEIGGDNAVRLHLLSLSRKDNARSIDYRAEVSAFRVACALEERAQGLSLQKEDMADLFVNVFSGETGKGVLTLERAASFYTDSDGEEPLSAAKKSSRRGDRQRIRRLPCGKRNVMAKILGQCRSADRGRPHGSAGRSVQSFHAADFCGQGRKNQHRRQRSHGHGLYGAYFLGYGNIYDARVFVLLARSRKTTASVPL